MPLIKCYHIEGNFGECKIWQLRYKNTFGDFGELKCNVISNKVFWRKNLWQIYGNLPNLPMFPPYKVSLYMVYIRMQLMIVLCLLTVYQITINLRSCSIGVHISSYTKNHSLLLYCFTVNIHITTLAMTQTGNFLENKLKESKSRV